MSARLATLAPFALVALMAHLVFPEAALRQPVERSSPSHDSLLSGELLARQYCSLCHQFPDPALLDKRTWAEKVLPNMALRLGIRETGQDPYKELPPEEQAILRRLRVYPEEPLLAEQDWKQIVHYYQQEAPAQPLSQQAHPPLTAQSLFEVRQLSFEEKPMPQISMLKYNAATGQLYVGDAHPFLYILDNRFEFQSAWNLESPPVAMDFPKNAPPRLLTIGNFNPSDLPLGRLLSFDTTGNLSVASLVNIGALPRPVHFVGADLNGDGQEDLVVCGFGNHAGRLSWYDGAQPTKEQVLKIAPGALKAEVRDFNRDGKLDIMVLMAQAWESMSIFYNQGNGQFREKNILQFTPVFGASYFELADFNDDGYLDILLANGDNWDFSRVNKNYHGIRIYLNDGKDRFEERWFFPLHGASKAMAGDFDGDGKLDIVATAFYADQGQLEKGFVYLANQGQLNFKPHALPEAVSGKWLTMEVGDFDGDGDLDVVLGSYLHNLSEFGQFTGYGITSFPQLLVLTNQADNRRSRSAPK